MNHEQSLQIIPLSHEAIDKEPKMYQYPFSSDAAKAVQEARERGVEISDWHAPDKEVGEIFKELDGPILELAGPTDIGFYYLDGQELPSRPIISNVAPDTLRSLPDGVREKASQMTELIVDGRHMEGVPDDSLGAVLAAHLDMIDEKNLSHEEVSKRLDRVDELMKRDADEGALSAELLEASLRLQVAQEVFKKLKPGGLYVTDGSQDELRVLSHVGFEPVAIHGRDLSGNDSRYFDAVLQKPELVK